MTRKTPAVWAASFLMLSFALLSAPIQAQPVAPSTQQMIDQLKPAAPGVASQTPGLAVPLSRGMRNLSVEAAPKAVGPGAASQQPDSGVQPSAAVVKPSLSLLIQFDFDSARVKPESQQALANLAQALQSSELIAYRFAVEGHTDAKGRPDYNRQLSQQRADAVRDFLGQHGVESFRLFPSGKGASELANPVDPFAAENRRVRIVNLN